MDQSFAQNSPFAPPAPEAIAPAVFVSAPDAMGVPASGTTRLDETGLGPVILDAPNLALRFEDAGVQAPSGYARVSSDLQPVLLDSASGRADDAIYTVYRGVAPGDTRDEIARRGLVYVALVMRPGKIGREWVRTRGHINSHASSTHLAFPEVHEIWQGEAVLYLQCEAARSVSDVVVMPLKAGDKAVIAPGWASLLVNVGDEPLAFGSWRTSDAHPEYANLEALGGMAHFVLGGDSPGAYELESNPRYRDVVAPRTLAARELPDFGLVGGEPMLTTFRRNPDFLRFMLRPQDFADVWTRLYDEPVAP